MTKKVRDKVARKREISVKIPADGRGRPEGARGLTQHAALAQIGSRARGVGVTHPRGARATRGTGQHRPSPRSPVASERCETGCPPPGPCTCRAGQWGNRRASRFCQHDQPCGSTHVQPSNFEGLPCKPARNSCPPGGWWTLSRDGARPSRIGSAMSLRRCATGIAEPCIELRPESRALRWSSLVGPLGAFGISDE